MRAIQDLIGLFPLFCFEASRRFYVTAYGNRKLRCLIQGLNLKIRFKTALRRPIRGISKRTNGIRLNVSKFQGGQ